MAVVTDAWPDLCPKPVARRAISGCSHHLGHSGAFCSGLVLPPTPRTLGGLHHDPTGRAHLPVAVLRRRLDGDWCGGRSPRWTILGWIVALVWSFTTTNRGGRHELNRRNQPRSFSYAQRPTSNATTPAAPTVPARQPWPGDFLKKFAERRSRGVGLMMNVAGRRRGSSIVSA
jgi:hypothetical protein